MTHVDGPPSAEEMNSGADMLDDEEPTGEIPELPTSASAWKGSKPPQDLVISTHVLENLAVQQAQWAQHISRVMAPSLTLLAQHQQQWAQQISEAIAPALERTAAAMRPFVERMNSSLAHLGPQILKSLQILHRTLNYPPNWHKLETLPPDALVDSMLLEEGLALAWVPDHLTLSKLFRAETRQARRRIIGRNWEDITRQCVAQLEQVHDRELLRYVRFMNASIRCLQAGEHEGAQALATNTLDSILREQFPSPGKVTSQKTGFSRELWHPQLALSLAGIWGVHGNTYAPQPVPRAFNRHATAHRVSGWQYNRINAMLAVMHTVGLMRSLQRVPPEDRMSNLR